MKFHLNQVLLPDGWQQNCEVMVSEDGTIESIQAQVELSPDATRIPNPVIPGLLNCHSHAFQRLMAGLTEARTIKPGGQNDAQGDSFWTWRTQMYQLVEQLSPDHLEVIASKLYMDMCCAGYTSVCEFHYLHHDRDGQRFAEPAAMSRSILNAAEQVGIGLTHLPVLYRYSGFGEKAPEPGQRRFINELNNYLQLVEQVQVMASSFSNLAVGVAPHSLRAVSAPMLDDLIGWIQTSTEDYPVPIHIHIAEQMQEVEQCLEHYGKAPVEWLLERHQIASNWCLVHATHVSPEALSAVAQSGAVAGLCPTTEANLGDGFFPMAQYHSQTGAWAVGSDSNMTLDPFEELRWLEYQQRLQQQKRSVLVAHGTLSPGLSMWQAVGKSAESISGRSVGQLKVGARADWLVVDNTSPELIGMPVENLLDALIFVTGGSALESVYIGGIKTVEHGEHRHQQAINHRFAKVIASLRS